MAAVLAATVRASVLMCDAANCACVSVDVWYSAADILTQLSETTDRASEFDRFTALSAHWNVVRSAYAGTRGEYACSC